MCTVLLSPFEPNKLLFRNVLLEKCANKLLVFYVYTVTVNVQILSGVSVGQFDWRQCVSAPKMTRDACWEITGADFWVILLPPRLTSQCCPQCSVISIISDACLCYGETVNIIILGVICSMNALLTFPVSYENVISECFLNFQNVQFF